MGNGRNDDKTKQYKIKTAKAPKKKVNQENKKEKKKHTKLKKFFLVCFVLGILLCLTGIGVFAGIFFSDEWVITKEDLEISIHNTTVYDSKGKQIAELTGDENRKIISLSEMGDYLPCAFIAIEDERFYTHYGIDVKRTAGAIATYIVNGGKSSFGGSTITQQLVKNMMNDNADSGVAGIERKIREWSRAYQIEQMMSKSQILELYLNKIFMGSTVYGVESASQYYFSKSAKKLSLAEAAFIAGINHAPNGYNPFGESDNSEKIKTRTKIVLNQMKKLKDTKIKELEKLTEITDEDYEKAIAQVEKGLKFKKGSTGTTSNISYHTAAAIDEVAKELAKSKDINYNTARAMIFNNGYKLYTTQDSNIQKIMEEEYKKKTFIKKATTKKGKKENAHSQSAMVIIDHKTGKVVGTVGGLGTDNSTLGLNRATDTSGYGRQPGSAIKPLVAIGPGLQENVITASTMYNDSPTSFGSYAPRNSTMYPGIISVRAAVERSSNVVNIKVLSNVGVDKGIEYAQAFGLSKYTKENDGMLSLALGGTYHGTNALEMAGAYATIANGGEYIEPTFYTKLESASGKAVLETKQEKRRVLSEQNAYVLMNILKSPVYGFYGHNTAGNCKISGMETAAKTGTTSDFKDRWLCGMTPYYTGATWFGYDEPETILRIGGVSNPASSIWANIMKNIHKSLKDKKFERPDGVVTAKICKVTGKAATSKCSSTYTEYFAKGTVPSECDGHESVKICKESKLLATEYCPETEEKSYPAIPEKERNPRWSTKSNGTGAPTKVCEIHTEETANNISVPNIVGKTESEARNALVGLTIRVILGEDQSKENGVVLKQSIKAGTTVKRGTTITITVNKVIKNNENTQNENQIKEPDPIPTPPEENQNETTQ